jgi:hypothetical protein
MVLEYNVSLSKLNMSSSCHSSNCDSNVLKFVFNVYDYKTENTAVGIRCADHATPSVGKKLALTSPTCGGRSVGIVRLRTKATEFSLVL